MASNIPPSDNKRRFVKLLPEIHNTETLKKFFGSTVDQMFQPGSSEQLSGYVGSKPDYYDAEKDFYISEPTPERTAYQLEPAMVSTSPSDIGFVVYSYSDLIGYLQSENAITQTQNRLFSDTFYGWAPPVDLDKFQNFRQYYWFGDKPHLVPALVINAGRRTYTADGQTGVFALPAARGTVPASREFPAVFVNGLSVDFERVGETVSLVQVPLPGQTVVVFRHSDLTAVLEDNATFDPRPFVMPVWKAGEHYQAGDVVSYPDLSQQFICQRDHIAGGSFNDAGQWALPHDPVLCPTALTSGMRLRFVDGVGFYQGFDRFVFEGMDINPPILCRSKYEVPWDELSRPASFWVEGVGSKIQIVAFPEKMTFVDLNPLYTVIDRRSRDGNPWSANNYWMHENAFRWAGVSFASRRAMRSIIEFLPNIELMNYGDQRRQDIQAVISGQASYIPQILDRTVDYTKPISDWDVKPFDSQPYEGSGYDRVNVVDANAKPIAQLFADDGHPLVYGDRVLVLQNEIPDLSGAILRVRKGTTTVTQTLPDGSTTTQTVECMVLLPEGAAVKGDVVRLDKGRWVPYDTQAGAEPWYLAHLGLDNGLPWEYLTDSFEFHFDGADWQQAQIPHATLPEPRFALYTDQKVRHDKLPNSTFVGNRLFGHAPIQSTEAGAVYDKILRKYVRYDNNQIIFRNDQVTERATSDKAEITGYQYFRVVGYKGDADQYSNSWYPTNELTNQSLIGNTFSIPMNLMANPDNAEIHEISRNQYVEHVSNILTRQEGFAGSQYNVNNWRDTPRSLGLGFAATRYWTAGMTYAVGDAVSHFNVVYRCVRAHTATGIFDETAFAKRPTHSIIQHRSPLLKTMLLASDNRFDYLDSARFVATEYSRFRTKFRSYITTMRNQGDLTDDVDPDVWVEAALLYLRQARTNEMPFSLSSMAGGQYFVPPTAAQMGLLFCYEPGIETDDTYVGGATFLRGHDGSRTAIDLNRFEDKILLALEQRIYRFIRDEFKTDADRPFDFFKYTDGRWRATGDPDKNTTGKISPCDKEPPPVIDGRISYSPDEIVKLFTPIFLRYAQLNGIDWRTNNTYVQTDPFTWNFHGMKDVFGTEMPGNFRAIYRYYYDTDRPHTVPWEMLGFGQKPKWWDTEYGAAPYTRGNMHLWEDLRDGVVRQGTRQGVDSRFVRPDLLRFIPVDDAGNLLNPIQVGIFTTPPKPEAAAAMWQVGDGGPGEELWRRSVDYPFAKSMFGYLMRPAEWVESGWDILNYRRFDDGQVYNLTTHNRSRAEQLVVHGEVINRKTQERKVILGVQQWVVDRLNSRSLLAENLGAGVRGLGVQLAHKMAGFTRADSLRVYADNSGILPDQDVTVIPHLSPPLRESVYSGVIIEWTGNGYLVIGYDTVRNGFCIEEGDENGQTQTIALGEDPQIYEWHSKIYYPVNTLVDYRGDVYRCNLQHTAGPEFEHEYWTPATIVNRRSPKVTIYLNSNHTKKFIPYGSIFSTREEVARFLWDYGRFLESEGFVFDYIDPKTGEVVNWELMIREFLAWSQMDWQPGNFIALSPGASQLKYVTAHGIVYNLEEVANGIYGLLDRTGRPIPHKKTFVSRLDEETKIITTTNDLFCARLRIGEAEHVVVFSNKTIFGDLIYEPILALRQSRLRMFGLRTNNWTGRLDAPGYAIKDNTVQANFWKSAENIRNMFEIEGSEDRALRDYSRHLTGYQKRPYLDNLLISETQQFEFFQGMIKQKGNPGVFDKLTRSRIVDAQSDLSFLEEWGFRIGSFGATDKFRRVSFRMERTDVRGNPQLVQFGAIATNDSSLLIPENSLRWIERPDDVLNVFNYTYDTPAQGGMINSPLNEDHARRMKTPGWVRPQEITYTVNNRTFLTQLYQELKAAAKTFIDGDRIWVYDMYTQERRFEVLRVDLIVDNTPLEVIDANASPKANPVIAMETNADDSFLSLDAMRFVFNAPHGLSAKDVGSYILIPTPIYNSDYDYGGFHEISVVESSTTILINMNSIANSQGGLDLSQDFRLADMVNLYVVRSVHFRNVADRDAFKTAYGFKPGELAYVDSVTGFPGWVVFQWVGDKWVVYRSKPKKIDSNRIKNALIYGLRSTVSDVTLSANPLKTDGIVVVDPILGNICGEAEREISFKQDNDPAQYVSRYYNANSVQNPAAWGHDHVGDLWWDTSTAYFVETESDVLDSGDDARTKREMQFRSTNWGRIAPGCAVDVYEWTRSYVPPYGSPDPTAGVVYNGAIFGDVNEYKEFDADLNKIVTVYYYWSLRPTTIPKVEGRVKSAKQVADLIANPRAEDITWIAPIAPNALLLVNVEDDLNDTDTVVQFDITDDDFQGVVHSEYALVRKGDPESLPPAILYKLLRNSLAGFDDFVQLVTNPDLGPFDRTGATLRSRRSMIAQGRSGVLAARQSFFAKLNEIMARDPLLVTNPNALFDLAVESPLYPQLIWLQPEGTDWVETPPPNSYDFVVKGLDEAAALLTSEAVMLAAGFKGFDTEPYDVGAWEYDFSITPDQLPNQRKPRLLITNYNGDKPGWAIWEINLRFTDKFPKPLPVIGKPKPPTPTPPKPKHPPVALDDYYDMVANTVKVLITAPAIEANDYDPDGREFSVMQLGPLPDGTPGRLTWLRASTWQYEVPAGTTGTFSIPYTIIDTAELMASAMIHIRIPNPIQAVDDYITTRLDQTFCSTTTFLLSNDIGSNIRVISISQPSAGSVEFDSASGSFCYRPPTGDGVNPPTSDLFTYTIANDAGQTASARVHVTLTQPPIQANDDSFEVKINQCCPTVDAVDHTFYMQVPCPEVTAPDMSFDVTDVPTT